MRDGERALEALKALEGASKMRAAAARKGGLRPNRYRRDRADADLRSAAGLEVEAALEAAQVAHAPTRRALMGMLSPGTLETAAERLSTRSMLTRQDLFEITELCDAAQEQRRDAWVKAHKKKG